VGEPAQTWHYGVVARYWAEFNVDGPEIAYFRKYVEAGQPALDVACGTGRLLIPYLRDGLDVDGADVSPDMLALCRERAEREGLAAPALYAQAMHELDLPRRYRTIYVCGGFGLGGTREQDLEGLRRLHEHLEPGGVLVMDNEVPYADAEHWKRWPKGTRDDLPREFRPPGERRRGADGTEYELRARLVDFDPVSQRETLEMIATMWRDGEPVAEDRYALHMNLYFKNELVLMLERTGFAEVDVRGGYDGGPPTGEHDFLVFVARKSD
jgi:SAM-dependent methyltransferase